MSPEELYEMKCGEIRNIPIGLVFQWMVTRVPSGWIYTCDKGQGHSVFVPYGEFFNGGF